MADEIVISEFPRSLYHEKYGEIKIDSQETMDLALSRGFTRTPPRLNTSEKLKVRIAEMEHELKMEKQNLVEMIREEQVLAKAEELVKQAELKKSVTEKVELPPAKDTGPPVPKVESAPAGLNSLDGPRDLGDAAPRRGRPPKE